MSAVKAMLFQGVACRWGALLSLFLSSILVPHSQASLCLTLVLPLPLSSSGTTWPPLFLAGQGLLLTQACTAAGWAGPRCLPHPRASAVFLPISRSPETLWPFKVMSHALWASRLPNFRHLACLRGSFPHQSNSPPAWHLRDFQPSPPQGCGVRVPLLPYSLALSRLQTPPGVLGMCRGLRCSF